MTKDATYLICGDSYSCETYNNPTYTWIELLKREHNIECRGSAGSTNVQILEQVLKHRKPNQGTIVSLTELDRGGDIKKSIKAVRKIAQLENVYVWSTYPDFMEIKSIDWQPFIAYNELFISKDKRNERNFTGCHFTREGNDAVYAHMKYIISSRRFK